MRTKEEAKDYRYFPEPDLPPFIVSKEKIEEIKKTIPELPRAKMRRFIREYGLSEYDAKILILNKQDAEFAEECLKRYPDKDKKPIANWIIGPLASLASASFTISQLKIPGGIDEFIKLVKFVEEDKISNLTAKSVLNESIAGGILSSDIIQEKNLTQVSDVASLEPEVEAVLKENFESVQAYGEGKSNALMFLVGQVMKRTAGRANPKIVQEILKRRLTNA